MWVKNLKLFTKLVFFEELKRKNGSIFKAVKILQAKQNWIVYLT
jgi:hypothetical protein